ncbi:hypothetical protein KSS94_22450 [Pseudomonas fakonensis]|uniref:Addiction module antidote protein n=1 Tax=Pseudomonas fakonensis TaxID=2842355 RepID=A0ABX8N2V2_9PSED|nr:hypothetical protein [Pseudomonas fakonensis]QXH50675.1 hypothetical protein KSS94_22450 [Pseudomonas fakonensis]
MPDLITPFRIVELLDSEAAIQEYLAQVIADGDAEEVISAQANIHAARSILASDTTE